MADLKSLLVRKSTGSAKVLHTEEELYKFFSNKRCDTKAKMILALIDEGHNERDIAHTLLKYGILSPKSFRQHVNNTVKHRK